MKCGSTEFKYSPKPFVRVTRMRRKKLAKESEIGSSFARKF